MSLRLHPLARFVLFPALALACMLAAALAGWGAARALRSPSRDTADASRTVAIGRARLKVPTTWTAIDPRSAGIPGLDSSSTRAFRIDDGLGRHAFVTLAAPANRRLIPSSLQPALRSPVGAPIPTFLAGYPAWSYSGVATASPNAVMELTVLPTTAGVLAVGCPSRSPAAAPSACDQDVDQLFVSNAHVLRPTPETAFRLAMAPVLTQLQADRAAVAAKLTAARDGAAQAQALQAFADAYDAAAGRLAALGPGQGRAATLVASLRSAARAYRTAGFAASAGAFGDYAVARAAVVAAEAKVAAAIGRLA